MSTDDDIINGLMERHGPETARRYAEQTMRVYRRAVLNPKHFASTAQYRRAFIMSYLFYKHYLRSCVAPVTGGGIPPRARPATPANPPARKNAVAKCERMIDDELAASMPASDPPSWTLGGSLVSKYQSH